MCGIAGIVDWEARPFNTAKVKEMAAVMQCRGPDDFGLHIERRAALTHRRLSIIDTSDAGRQPMSNEDASVWIVFNGEIYNFRELRSQLEGTSHRFRSRTDTEVLVHGYEEWGAEELARRARGMFAYAIWDANRGELHLTRDHVGKKPLYYRQVDGKVVFASDVKAIWLEANRSLDIDEKALDEFLTFYWISSRRCIFRGVEKVPPSHVVTFNGQSARSSTYWRPSYSRKEDHSVDDWLEGTDFHMRQAVRRRLIADVPIGAFLSGGVDSSCVSALMAQQKGPGIRTFSVGQDAAPELDERRHARDVARHIGSDHTELVVSSDVSSLLTTLVWHYGEPFADASAIPTYLIAKAARPHVTVVLTGDGGDECFAGYSIYSAAHRWWRWRYLPASAKHALIAGTRAFRVIAPLSLTGVRAEKYARSLAGDSRILIDGRCWYDSWRRRMYDSSWNKKLRDWTPQDEQSDIIATLDAPTPTDRALAYWIAEVLPSNYLVKVDVATMASSLEARSPFLDVDLLDFTSTIPAHVLLKAGETKWLLKQYASQLVPPHVVHRPKQGFALPIGQWCRTTWRRPLEDLLLGPSARSRGYFKPSFIRTLIDQHASGRANYTTGLWALIVFEVWNRLFIDRDLVPGDPILT